MFPVRKHLYTVQKLLYTVQKLLYTVQKHKNPFDRKTFSASLKRNFRLFWLFFSAIDGTIDAHDAKISGFISEKEAFCAVWISGNSPRKRPEKYGLTKTISYETKPITVKMKSEDNGTKQKFYICKKPYLCTIKTMLC